MKRFIPGVILLALLAIAAWSILAKPRLATAPSSKPSQASPATTSAGTGQSLSVAYSCNEGKSITATFHPGKVKPPAKSDEPPTSTDTVDVKLSDGRSMTLRHTTSADGARYSDGDPRRQGSETFVFLTRGNGAFVLEDNEQKSYTGCIEVASEPAGSNLSEVYSNGPYGFSLRYPKGYRPDASYQYQGIGPDKAIPGVKFTIPASMAQGTNLGSDSYISVELLPETKTCTADLFLDHTDGGLKSVTKGGITYSVASATGEGAGNRYDETVYAIPGTNPCMAVRYYIHYSVFEIYPPGTIRQFDEQALTKEFDAIGRTLVVNQ